MIKQLINKKELLEWINYQIKHHKQSGHEGWADGYNQGWNSALRWIKEHYYD